MATTGISKKQMGTAFRKQQAVNLQEIHSACEHNMELTQLALQAIQSYKSNTSSAEGSGQTIGNLVKSKVSPLKKSKSATDLISEDDVQKMFRDAQPLARGRYLYRNWGIGMLQDLLFYCIPGLTRSMVSALRDVEKVKEIVEYAWDLQCTERSTVADRVACLDKKGLFDRLRAMYIEKGQRCQAFISDFSQGYVCWERHGHYSVEVTREDGKVRVCVAARLEGKKCYLPQEVVDCDDWESVKIMNNCSITSAFLQTAEGETYCIKALFPQMNRKLKRQLSDGKVVGDIEGMAGKFPKVENSTGGTPEQPGQIGTAMAMPVLSAEDDEGAEAAEGMFQASGDGYE